MLATGNFPKVLDCLKEVGLQPHILTEPQADLADISAVLIPGGGDIDPECYGGNRKARVYGVDEKQDALDFWLAEYAVEHDLPLLGICRGAQILNVFRGGSLHEDLPEEPQPHHNNMFTARDSSVFVHHAVSIERESKLSESLRGATRAIVPSAHHQGIKELGHGLRVVARADDGVIEGFEGTTGWLMAVQWHPEADADSPIQKYGQFAALAEAIALERTLT